MGIFLTWLVLTESLLPLLLSFSLSLYLSISRLDSYKKLEVRGSKDSTLGEGAYGVVYKALDTVLDRHVALKKIRLETEEEGIPTTALREMSLLRQLDHPNVVRLENVVMEPGKLYLVFELVDTDLKKLMDSSDEPFRPDLVQVSLFVLPKPSQPPHRNLDLQLTSPHHSLFAFSPTRLNCCLELLTVTFWASCIATSSRKTFSCHPTESSKLPILAFRAALRRTQSPSPSRSSLVGTVRLKSCSDRMCTLAPWICGP